MEESCFYPIISRNYIVECVYYSHLFAKFILVTPRYCVECWCSIFIRSGYTRGICRLLLRKVTHLFIPREEGCSFSLLEPRLYRGQEMNLEAPRAYGIQELTSEAHRAYIMLSGGANRRAS